MFFRDSVKAEGLTLPKSLLLPVSALTFLYIFCASLAPPSKSTIFPSSLYSYLFTFTIVT